jgi:hypothetical protein
MLRKQARPGLGIGVDLDVVLGRYLAMNYVPRHHSLHCGCALFDDARVFHVQGDPQPVDVADRPRDAAVAQVEAKQVDVCG